MAYRKTEKVLAELEAKRELIIASAIDVVARHGLEGLNTQSLARRAGISEGGIFRHFPDMTELRAAMVASVLQKDLAAIAGIATLDAAITAWGRIVVQDYRVRDALGKPYREGMRKHFEKVLRTVGVKSPARRAAVAVGAVMERSGQVPRFEPALTDDLLMACEVGAKSEVI